MATYPPTVNSQQTCARDVIFDDIRAAEALLNTRLSAHLAQIDGLHTAPEHIMHLVKVFYIELLEYIFCEGQCLLSSHGRFAKVREVMQK
jgi:hypothetical protein